MTTERIARHLVIRGRVQGVWFRESMRMQAERLGVSGWVRNRMDGSVEAVIQGSPDSVEAMTRWASRGPEAAHVTGVDVSEASGDYARFEKRPTG